MRKYLPMLLLVLLVTFIVGCNPVSEVLENPPARATEKITGELQSVEFYTDGQDTDMTVVKFNDGRVKAFDGRVYDTFQIGKVNTITYGKRYGIDNPQIEVVSVRVEK